MKAPQVDYGVLIHFPKEHSKPAWLSQNGKTRWSKKQATVHRNSVESGKIWIPKRLKAEVVKRT